MTDDKVLLILDKYRKLAVFEDYEIRSFEDVGMDDDTPLHMAAYLGDIEALAVMLPLIESINRKGDIGNSPLHYAVMAGSAEAVELLLTAGADISATNDYGDTPVEMIDKNRGAILEAIERHRSHS